MKITHLKERSSLNPKSLLAKLYSQYERLLEELAQKELPETIVETINASVDQLNAFSGSDKDLKKTIKKQQTALLNLLQKELRLTPKGYYRNMWLAMGLSALWVPFGLLFALALNNMAFLGLGVPIGLMLGIVLGARFDAKAAKEGRQLNVEIKY